MMVCVSGWLIECCMVVCVCLVDWMFYLITVDNGDGEEEHANNTIEIDIEVAMGNDHHDSQMMTQDISDDEDANGDEDDDEAGNRGILHSLLLSVEITWSLKNSQYYTLTASSK